MTAQIKPGEEFDVLPEGAEVTFVPLQHVSAVQISALSNEFSLTFTAPQLGHALIDGERQTVAQNVPVGHFVLSPLVVKDLALLFTKAIQDYEAEWGVVHTVYTRRLEAAKGETAG